MSSPSVDIKSAITDCNAFIKNAGLTGSYAYRAPVGNGLHIVECTADGKAPRVVAEDTLRNVYDELYREVTQRLGKHAVMLSARVASAENNPLPSKAVYEAIISLTEVALDGVEARKRDADGIADVLNVEEGQYAVSRGQAIVDHYSDAYRGGDLK